MGVRSAPSCLLEVLFVKWKSTSVPLLITIAACRNFKHHHSQIDINGASLYDKNAGIAKIWTIESRHP